MKLGWRDLIATLLVAAAVMVAVAVTQQWGWPWLGSVRTGGLAIGAIGLGACIVGGTAMTGQEAETALRSPVAPLGYLAFGLALGTAIVGTEVLLIALVVDEVVLWIVTTVRHALGRSRVDRHAVGATS